MVSVAHAYAKRLLDLFRARRYDLVWIYQEAMPYLPDHWLLRLLRLRFVHDIDDAYYLKHIRSPNLFLRHWVARKWHYYARNARVVFAGSEALVQFSTRCGSSRVFFAPTVVSTEQFVPRVSERPLEAPIRIGWIGSPTTAQYLKPIARALSEVQSRTGAEIIVIGAGEGFSLEGCRLTLREWSLDHEVQMIQEFDVGIMPLPDDEWSRAKCGFKLVQYMACGLPSVASPVGANREIIRKEIDGLWATNEAEWIDALLRLARDSMLRSKLGQEARRRAVSHYSAERWAPLLVQALTERAVDKSAANQ